MRAVGDAMSDLKDEVVSRVLVDAGQAKRELDDVITRLKSIPEHRDVAVKVDADMRQLDELEARLRALKGRAAGQAPSWLLAPLPAFKPDPSVLREIESVEAELERTRASARGLVSDLDALATSEARSAARVRTARSRIPSIDIRSLGAELDAEARRMFAAIRVASVLTPTRDLRSVVAGQSIPAQDLRDVTSRITLSASQAKAALAGVLAAEKALPKRETITIRIDADLTRLAQLRADMERLRGQGDSIGMGRVQGEIDSTVTRLRNLDTEFRTLHRDANREIGGIAGALHALDDGFVRVLRNVGQLRGRGFFGNLFGSAAQGLADLLDKVGNAVESLVSSLPNAVGGFAAVISTGLGLASVVGVVILLVGAVTSLVSVLASAVAGVVLLGGAFLIALAPIAVLLAVVVAKFAAAVTGANQVTAATQGLKSATDSLHAAQTRLAQAQANVHTQRLAAIQAEKDATLQLADAQNAYKDAVLAVESAKLSHEQALLDLAKFRQTLAGFGLSPGSLTARAKGVDVVTRGQLQVGADPLGYKQLLLDYQQLLLNVKTSARGIIDSKQGVKDAANNLAKAEENVAKYMREQLRAFPAYNSALNEQANAMNALAAAQDRIATATTKLAAAQTSAPAAAITAWQKFTGMLNTVFGPAINAIFDGITGALQTISTRVANDPKLRQSILHLGQVMGQGIQTWANAFTSPQTLSNLNTLVNNSASLVPDLVSLFDSISGLLLELANFALPFVKGILDGWAKSLSHTKDHTKAIRDFVQDTIGHARSVWNAFKTAATWIGKVATFCKNVFDDLSRIADFIGPAGVFGIAVAGLAIGFKKAFAPVFAAYAVFKEIQTIVDAINATNHAQKNAQATAKSNLGYEKGTALPAIVSGTPAPRPAGVTPTIAQRGSVRGRPSRAAQIRSFMESLVGQVPEVFAEGQWTTLAILQATLRGELAAYRSAGGSLSGALAQWVKYVLALHRRTVGRPAGPGAQPEPNVPSVPVPRNAAGGVALNASLGIFGEAGTEALVPLAGAGAQLVAQALGRYLVADLGAMMPRSVRAGNMASTPGDGGIHYHQHNWRLNQGDTIVSDEHFMAVVERQMTREGWGRPV